MASSRPLRILPLGDCAALIEYSPKLDPAINSFIQRLGRAVEDAVREQRLAHVRDIVPALGGLALHFDPDYDGNVLQAAAELAERCTRRLPSEREIGQAIEVPVCYEGALAPDITEVAAKLRLTPERVAELHAASAFRVLMMGFAPGHAYMGGLDPRLAVPRRANPRAEVAAGSVAIANDQTVVYPYAISGGWSVIGRTPLVVFDAARPRPSLFLAGDRVRFRAISREEFDRLSGGR